MRVVYASQDIGNGEWDMTQKQQHAAEQLADCAVEVTQNTAAMTVMSCPLQILFDGCSE